MTDLDGADPDLVRTALDRGDPLPGTAGFAGELDGALVRDVLGRRPLFSEAGDPTTWSADPTDLDAPDPVPAGHLRGAGAGVATETADEDGDGTRGGDETAGRTDRRVWSLPDPPAADPAAATAAARAAVRGSVESVDPEGVAVAFSGGVDSALVAAGVPDAPCYVAGFEGAHDVAAARAAAEAMGRDLRVVELRHADLERAVPELVRATGRTNPMDLAIALPLYLTAERAAADGFDRLAVGQGADELFGGYAKVVDPAGDHRVAADTVRGATREVIATLPDQLERDALALRAAGVDPVAPLLADRVVVAALALPGDLLATPDERKVALRRAADGLVPAEVAAADKKAVQYGTYVSRELDRLARRAGFKRRMDDHVERYVESLL